MSQIGGEMSEGGMSDAAAAASHSECDRLAQCCGKRDLDLSGRRMNS